MEKKEPHPEMRPHLEDSFSTVGFFNRCYDIQANQRWMRRMLTKFQSWSRPS